jgi:hypothetical protein
MKVTALFLSIGACLLAGMCTVYSHIPLPLKCLSLLDAAATILSQATSPDPTMTPTTMSPTKNPLGVPTKVPTTTHPTFTPFVNTHRPTAAPFQAPALTTGWIYINQYLTKVKNVTLANCPAFIASSGSGTIPDYVSAVRIGACLANTTDDSSSNNSGTGGQGRAVFNYFTYSCDSQTGLITATQYDNYQCIGTSIGTVSVSLSVLSTDDEDENDDDDDDYVTCSNAMCTSSSTLPLPENVPYFVQEQYQDFLAMPSTTIGAASANDAADQCYNAEIMFATINDKCLAWNDYIGMKYEFPFQLFYNSSSCASNTLLYNFTMPSGCLPADNLDMLTLGNADTAFTDAIRSSHSLIDVMSSQIFHDGKKMRSGASLMPVVLPAFAAKGAAANNDAGRHLKRKKKTQNLFAFPAIAYVSQGIIRAQSDGIDDDDYAGEPQAFKYSKVTIASSSPSSAATLSNGAIAGIVIGSVAVVAIVVFAAIASGVLGGGCLIGHAVAKKGIDPTNMELHQNPVHVNAV